MRTKSRSRKERGGKWNGDFFQEERAGIGEVKARAKLLVHPSVVAGHLSELFATVTEDVTKGREVLTRHLGKITMTPAADGTRKHYVATGAFNLGVALGRPERLLDNLGCGGRI